MSQFTGESPANPEQGGTIPCPLCDNARRVDVDTVQGILTETLVVALRRAKAEVSRLGGIVTALLAKTPAEDTLRDERDIARDAASEATRTLGCVLCVIRGDVDDGPLGDMVDHLGVMEAVKVRADHLEVLAELDRLKAENEFLRGRYAALLGRQVGVEDESLSFEEASAQGEKLADMLLREFRERRAAGLTAKEDGS